MELQKPKIALYVKRSFGEKLNVSFDFIKESWRLLLKFTTYLLLPLCLIQALSLNGFVSGALNMSKLSEQAMQTGDILSAGLVSFFIHYLLYAVLYIIGTILMTSMVYALIRTYNEREERLQGTTLGTIRPLLLRNIKRMLLLMLVGFFIVVLVVGLMVALAALTPYTLILTLPLFFACLIPFTLWVPIYLFEDVKLMESLGKTFRLGFATWGGIFLISLVMGIIANVLQGVTMAPWYVSTLVKYFFSVSDTGGAESVSVWYNFMLYLLGILQTFGVYLSMIFGTVGLAYQYGHASEVVDAITVESDIENFDKL